jgi:deoxyadenosine/deoxycytidine kinase
MTRESPRGVIIIEDRPFVDGPEVFVKRMIESGEMPAAHAKLYRTLFHQTLRNEHIRLPDLTVYLRTEPDVLERRRAKRAAEGDDYAATITLEYLREIHDSYETVAANWRRTLQQREIRHLMTRESPRGVIIVEDRPFVDGPEVFVKRMIESGEMPAAHAALYRTLFHQTLRNEHIRLPDLTVYLRSEADMLERRRAKRAQDGDGYAATISADYLRAIHECYEAVSAAWKDILLKYMELAIVPPDADILILPAEIDMYEHPDYVHVAAGTIREKIRRMIATRRQS